MVRECNHLPKVTELGKALSPLTTEARVSFRQYFSSVTPQYERTWFSRPLHLRHSSLVFLIKKLTEACNVHHADLLISLTQPGS